MRWLTNLLTSWRAARAKARAEQAARTREAKRFAMHIALTTQGQHLRNGSL
jgi:hypothetical protein